MKKIKISRRDFLRAVTAAGILANAKVSASGQKTAVIDRPALVGRHNPVLRKIEPLSPLSVGNGEFAFTCDVTGLQTFPQEYETAMPLCTMSQWGWHTAPNPKNFKESDLRLTEYQTGERKVGYMTSSEGQKELFDWLRQNPHRLHLGQIGLKILKTDGREIEPKDLTDIEQKLDLWQGIITSRFKVEGKQVSVKTAAHPAFDAVAVSVESALIAEGKLSIKFNFPYGSPEMSAADWKSDSKHTTSGGAVSDYRALLLRSLDNDSYSVNLAWMPKAQFKRLSEHGFLLTPSQKTTKFGFVASFSADVRQTAETVFKTCAAHWKNFWTTGGAVDLSESIDKRAHEIERRVVLSQYLTAINCAGSRPPQETGLVCNSWYGKFHLEMHWWHAAHFTLWNRTDLLEKSLKWYMDVLASAQARAHRQGYTGARWAKMTAPDGRDSPSPIGTLLIWQQPHPIFYAELCYLSHPNRETLEKYQVIVDQTAEFMASFAHYDEKNDRYVLGPPVIPAQENHPPNKTWNPTFELEYWHFALQTANRWRERLGMKPFKKWQEIVSKLSPLPVKDGVYLAHENCPQTFTERNHDHPSMLGALGVLKGALVDRETMRRTLKKVLKEWSWDDTWGWDYPLTALTAARLGEPEAAVNALLMETPKNHYAANGHNYQRPNLPCYLPGNGGLLYAVAVMAAGLKDSEGFPDDGRWKIRTENLNVSLIEKLYS